MSKPVLTTKTDNTTHHDLEINALLNRLHAGCRFIDFDELSSSGAGSGDGTSSSSKDAYNRLRNISSPDEIHAELGRGLAHSYIELIVHSITSIPALISLSSDNSDGHAAVRQAVVKRGEHILRSLCCGEETTLSSNSRGSGSGRWGQQSSLTGMNYASTANAYFHSLHSYCSTIDNNDNSRIDKSNAAAIMIFLRSEWQKWCVHCEELISHTHYHGGGGVHVLNACLKSYTRMCFMHHDASDDGINNKNGISRVYGTLIHQSSRKYLIRTCVGSAFHVMNQPGDNVGANSFDSLVESVSPLFHTCILAARKANTSTDQYHPERMLLLQEILKICSFSLRHERNFPTLSQIACMVRYLTSSLTTYLTQSVRAAFSKKDSYTVDIFELSYDWLCGICDLSQSLLLLAKDDSIGGSAVQAISSSMEQILTVLLPQFTTGLGNDVSMVIDMTPIYSKVNNCIDSLPQSNLRPIANAYVVLRLGALALTLQDDEEVTLIIEMILSIMKYLENDGEGCSRELFIGGVLTALGCISRCRPVCYDAADRLYALGETILCQARCRKDNGDERKDDVLHLMKILCYSMDEGKDFLSVFDIVTASISEAVPPIVSCSSWQRRPLLLPDQCAGLLIGLSLLHMSVKSPEVSTAKPSHAFVFLKKLLHTYPRMASRVVPSIIDIARASLDRRSTLPTAEILLDSLEFLSAKCIVSDAHGAHLAWTFLSSLTTEEMPPAVRSTIIRLLPGMCSSNKRLFRRAIGVIGKSMLAQDPIIRVAATAALSDMAKLDLIRDVEIIVGWVQRRLVDEELAVRHYALAVLRHLIVNEELEFDLVVRVLEKRLSIDLSDSNTIVSLDMLVLEELVALMGQGGLDEDEDDNDVKHGPTASPQTTRSVALLVELALLPQFSIKNCIGQVLEVEVLTTLRVQRVIYSSLAGYSAGVLGLESESIRSWDGDAPSAEESGNLSSELKRYLQLKEIALNLDCVARLFITKGFIDNDDGVVQELLESAASISKTLLQFEEDVYGSFLFRSGQPSGRDSGDFSSKSNADKSRVSKSVLSLLPTASLIQEKFQSDPRSATAVGMLYSIGFSDDASSSSLEIEDILSKISECLGDVINETFEPIFHTMQICSMIHCMSTIWKYIQCAGDSVKDELLDQVLGQLDEWSEVHGDSAHVATAAFFMAVDDSAYQHRSVLARIQQTIVDSDDTHHFQSEETKVLCLGMVAARLCYDLDSRVTGIITSIERSILNSRQIYFGGLFGLSMIMTNLAGNENNSDSSAPWRRQHVRRIICILLATFNTCLAQESDVVNNLISFIEIGKAESDLVHSFYNSESLCIQDGSALTMRSVLLAIGSSVPALSIISSDLLKCVLILVDKLPWGSGKGFVLHAAYKNGIKLGAVTQNDLLHAISRASNFLQDSDAGVGVGDAILSLALLCQISPEKVRKELDYVADKCQEIILKSNGAQESRDDKLLAILAGCAMIGELPGLTVNTPTIHTSAKRNVVASYTQMLVDMASNESVDQKYRDCSTIGLGLLCAMRSSGYQMQAPVSENKLHKVQTKEGTMMQAILREIEQSYSCLCKSPHRDRTNSPVFAKKLCSLFSTLEPIALPGSFASVIELTLKVSMSSEEELKSTCMNLLISQLESRRRIGFDGRGFVDLATRLANMPPNELHALIGSSTSILMTSLPNLIHQLPTSTAEEVVPRLWAICRYELIESIHSFSATEFLLGIQSIMSSMNESNRDMKHTQRKSLSPALLRTLRKFIAVEVFSDLCTDAVHNTRSVTVWTSYLQCLQHTPDAIAEMESQNCDINQTNVFGMSTIAMVSPKSARRVEAWISRQDTKDMPMANQRSLLLSIINIAIQPRNEAEVKESILSHFEVMLVKGIDTMGLYIVAAKVAFWWDSRAMHQLEFVDMPIQRVSNVSSFYVNANLVVGANALTPKMLGLLFDAFISDLPSKLAVLCHMWNVSDELSNRATRILSAALPTEGSDSKATRHNAHAIACLRDLVNFITGGEPRDNK